MQIKFNLFLTIAITILAVSVVSMKSLQAQTTETFELQSGSNKLVVDPQQSYKLEQGKTGQTNKLTQFRIVDNKLILLKANLPFPMELARGGGSVGFNTYFANSGQNSLFEAREKEGKLQLKNLGSNQFECVKLPDNAPLDFVDCNSVEAVKVIKVADKSNNKIKPKNVKTELIAQVDGRKAEADRLFAEANKLLESPGQNKPVRFNYLRHSALKPLGEALKIYNQIGEREQERRVSYTLGKIYWSLGRYKDGVKFYEQAWAIDKEIGNLSQEEAAQEYNELEAIVMPRGNYLSDSYLDSRQDMLPIIERFTEKYGWSNLLAEYYLETKQYPKAIELLKNNYKTPSDNISLASAYFESGDYDRALEYYQKGSLADGKVPFEELGNVYLALRDYSKAIDYYKQAQDQDRQSQSSSIQYVPLGLPVALFKSGKAAEAETMLYSELNKYKRIYDGPDANYADVQSNMYTGYGDTKPLIPKLLQKVLVAQNKFKDALEVSELSRNRVFVTTLARKLTSQASVPPPSLGKLQEIAKQQNSTVVEYSLIYDEKISSQNIVSRDAEESELYIWVIKPDGSLTFRSVELKSLLQQSQNPLINFWEEKVTGKYLDVLKLLLATSLVILIIWFSPQLLKRRVNLRSFKNLQSKLLVLAGLMAFLGFVFLLTQQGQSFTKVRGASTGSGVQNQTSLEKLIYSTYNSINTRGNASNTNQLYQDLQKQYQLYIQPIVDLLPSNPDERVIFVPEDKLFLVSFAALQDAKGKYLIEKHTILTAPSIQALEFTHRRRQELGELNLSSLQPGNALVVGNPTMPVYLAATEKPKQLSSLPNAEKEAEQVAKLLNTQVITGKEATEKLITNLLPNSKLIHLATHGLPDEFPAPFNGKYYGMGYRGAIVLAPSSAPEDILTTDQSDDYYAREGGFLTAGEIMDLNLKANLAVLSACNTGVGRIIDDGVLGLPRSFLAAGVPSVVVSLFVVLDDSTTDLMTHFYQNLQKNPDKAQALRQAMLATMKQRPNPVNWAAFTLIGEAE